MIVVGNGTVITLDENHRVIANGAVFISKDIISDVGTTNELVAKYPNASFIDAKGGLIMPGMTNIHTHCYSSFARGMTVPGEPAQNFPEILERLWWRLDKSLTEEMIYYSALVTMLECVRNGTTTIIDHHASPFAVSGSLLQMAKATEFIGVRSSHCYEVSDRDGKEIARKGIEENKRFIEYCKEENNPLLKASFGIHASFTVGDDTLKQCALISKDLDVGIHVHAAEDLFDVQETKRLYNTTVIERFHQYGLLGPKTIAAHCVHISDQEIELLAKTGTAVAHNPESNMGNAVGCADIKKLLDAGVTIGMGTDGYTSDMFEGIKVGNLLHKHENRNPQAAWSEIPTLIFDNNRKILANHFDKPVGVIAPGAYADIITVDYDPHTPLTSSNYYGHLLFGVSGGLVNTTIIGGKLRMYNRNFIEIDDKEIRKSARELADKLWKSL